MTERRTSGRTERSKSREEVDEEEEAEDEDDDQESFDKENPDVATGSEVMTLADINNMYFIYYLQLSVENIQHILNIAFWANIPTTNSQTGNTYVLTVSSHKVIDIPSTFLGNNTKTSSLFGFEKFFSHILLFFVK